MSDSDCSNCDESSCKFRDFAYSCYKNKVAEVQKHLTKADVSKFKRMAKRAEALYNESGEDAFYQLAHYANDIVNMYKGE